MALQFHPAIGTVVICDYNGFVKPEMVKRRPAIVISPQFKHRGNLCSVVPLSTSEPDIIMPYHYKLDWANKLLLPPYDSPFHWVKGDMFATVSFSRLTLPHTKDRTGKRIYITRTVSESDLKKIRECVLHSIDLSYLTVHL